VNLELTLLGIYDDPDESETLFFHYKYLRELLKNLGWGEAADLVGVLLVQAHSPEAAATVAVAIDRGFENSPFPTKTEAERLWQLSFISFLGELKKFLLAMSAALTFTVVLVSANTVSMSVRERVREIATLKVLGFTKAAILGTILGESALISLLGGAGGLLLAGGTCLLIRNSVRALAGLKLNLTPEVALAVLGASVLVGLASSMVPAFRAANGSILDSLRAVE
jgi:putative ABC transport system permease protein